MISWAAGYFDASGTTEFRYDHTNLGWVRGIRVSSLHIAILLKFQLLFGGTITPKGRGFVWRVGTEEAVRAAKKLQRYSIGKKSELTLFVKANSCRHEKRAEYESRLNDIRATHSTGSKDSVGSRCHS